MQETVEKITIFRLECGGYHAAVGKVHKICATLIEAAEWAEAQMRPKEEETEE